MGAPTLVVVTGPPGTGKSTLAEAVSARLGGAVHRCRIEGRRRDIPGWHELTWDGVQRTLARWAPPAHPDLTVDTAGDPDPGPIAARLTG